MNCGSTLQITFLAVLTKRKRVGYRKRISAPVIVCLGPRENIICVKPKIFLSLAMGNVTGPEGNEGTE